MLKTDHTAEHFELDICRHGGRKALQIQLVRPVARRLEKELMPDLVGEANHLILYARAVSRPDTLYFAGIKRRAVNISPDYLMRFFVCVRDIAGKLGTRI